MKFKIHSKAIICFWVLLFSTLFTAFNYRQNSKVVYAIASREIHCKSGNAGYKTTTDIEIKLSQGSGNFSEERKKLGNELKNSYSDDGVKIKSNTIGGKVVVVIKFKKNMSPYDCEKYVYSLGGANTYDEALKSALRSNSVGNQPYDVIRTINNN
jgi:hypothetical protein